MPQSSQVQYRAARIASALQERIIGQQSLLSSSGWFAFFLETGHAQAETGGGDYEMSGPAVLWGPLDPETRLRVGAGSQGSYVVVNPRILADATGPLLESAELQRIAQRPVLVSLPRRDPRRAEFETVFERLTAEAGSARFGTDIAIGAYVRLLLVLLWRVVEDEGVLPDPPAVASSLINQFRSLVETHFRERRPASDYAARMGMSYDRLHDLCVRNVGKPPARLIRERTLREAQMMLERTALSADRISVLLGFSSASQFSHFFKAMCGQPPGDYRRGFARRSDAAPPEVPRFSDWP